MVTATRRRRQRPKMTPQDAAHFSRYSIQNAATVADALECGCEPYRDVFTYGRWQALGFQVQRGQKAVKIPVIIQTEHEDEEGNVTHRRQFWTGAVFCRHQVQAATDKAKAPASFGSTKPRMPEPKPAPTPPPTSSQVDQLMNQWKAV